MKRVDEQGNIEPYEGGATVYGDRMVEVWRDVEGYEGKYQVSNIGGIRNIQTGRTLKPQPNKKDGYMYIALSNSTGRSWKAKMHRLVGIAFISPDPERKYIDHIDGNKHNNNVSNLRWVTFQENINAAWKTGLYYTIGERHPQSKLTNKDVLIIKQRLLNGEKGIKIAEDMGYNKAAIYDIKQGRTWTHIK